MVDTDFEREEEKANMTADKLIAAEIQKEDLIANHNKKYLQASKLI